MRAQRWGGAVIALALLLLTFLLPDLDVDGDGYGARVEHLAGCSNLDRESLPYCSDDWHLPIACSPTGPGVSVPLSPCPPEKLW